MQEKLEEFDKISAALPKVQGLGEASDTELDELSQKAEQAFDDLMDLGMQVDSRYGPRMFEVAAQMLNAAINAKNAKITNKLKMVDLQLKKYSIDKKNSPKKNEEDPINADGFLITDRNSLIDKLKNMKK